MTDREFDSYITGKGFSMWGENKGAMSFYTAPERNFRIVVDKSEYRKTSGLGYYACISYELDGLMYTVTEYFGADHPLVELVDGTWQVTFRRMGKEKTIIIPKEASIL